MNKNRCKLIYFQNAALLALDKLSLHGEYCTPAQRLYHTANKCTICKHHFIGKHSASIGCMKCCDVLTCDMFEAIK